MAASHSYGIKNDATTLAAQPGVEGMECVPESLLRAREALAATTRQCSAQTLFTALSKTIATSNS